MKYLMLIGDGMADHRVPELGKKTPLQAAKTPNMDRLAREGLCGMVKTLPENMPRGSDVAMFSLLGYDPQRYYTGRGPLEALSLGIKLNKGDIAFRCNLVTVKNGKLIDYSAGHISPKEGKILVQAIENKLGNENFSFFPGLSYRNIMVSKKRAGLKAENLSTVPPHDILDSPVRENLPKGSSSQILRKLMEESKKILAKHPLNLRREKRGQNPANMLWLWGQGEKPSLPSFYHEHKKKGTIISAVDIIKGIGRAVKMEVAEVKGATGFLDTNYRGKAKAALRAIRSQDFVLVHVEAPDETSHLGDFKLKIRAIEDFDRKIVGPIIKGLGKDKENFKVYVGCDHATPLSLRTHSNEAVPFLIWGGEQDQYKSYDEISIRESKLYFEKGHELMEFFLTNDYRDKKRDYTD